MPEIASGKIHATVIETHVERGYVFAEDANGIRYFIFERGVEIMGTHYFDELQFGSRVKLTPIFHPKGPRGIEVEILSL